MGFTTRRTPTVLIGNIETIQAISISGINVLDGIAFEISPSMSKSTTVKW